MFSNFSFVVVFCVLRVVGTSLNVASVRTALVKAITFVTEPVKNNFFNTVTSGCNHGPVVV